jgi:hypothetical protein
MDEILWLVVGMSKIIQSIANSLKFTTKLITHLLPRLLWFWSGLVWSGVVWFHKGVQEKPTFSRVCFGFGLVWSGVVGFPKGVQKKPTFFCVLFGPVPQRFPRKAHLGLVPPTVTKKRRPSVWSGPTMASKKSPPWFGPTMGWLSKKSPPSSSTSPVPQCVIIVSFCCPVSWREEIGALRPRARAGGTFSHKTRQLQLLLPSFLQAHH